MKNGFLLLSVLFPSLLFARGPSGDNSNWLGISQGTSSPTRTSTLNFSNGFMPENPVGVIYQQGVRLTGEGDHGDDSQGNDNAGFGGELGIGDGQYGLAVGYYNRDCESCDGDFVGALGVSFADVGLGIRFAEELYSAGLIFNTHGKHRFGLMAQLNDPDGDDNNISSFGAGYSYNGDRITFSVDAAKRSFENDSAFDDTILVTPGLAVHFQMLSFSLSYDHFVDEDPNDPNGRGDDLWFGVGFGDKTDWYVAIYHDYVNEWSVSASFFF